MDRAQRNAHIIAAYEAGETQQRIAARLGLSQACVSKVIVLSGKSRGQGTPRILPTDPEQRRRYEKLRSILGVEAARKEIGL